MIPRLFSKLLSASTATACALALCAGSTNAQEDYPGPARKEEKRAQREGRNKAPRGDKRDTALSQQPADVAALAQASVILGRPTATGIAANFVSARTTTARLEYGTASGHYSASSPTITLLPGKPQELDLTGLQSDTRYFYRVTLTPAGEPPVVMAEQQFQTQRAPGKAFVFELQGDSHPERPQQFDAALYAQTLRAVAADRPDFYILMGDDFSVDTLHQVNAQTVAQRYWLQRPYLALVGQTAPLFLVNGNHEQASAANLDGTPDNVAVWAQTSRNAIYPQPAPDDFYSGNQEPVPYIGLLRNYFAWTWGDALFVVIDPYWHSNTTVDNAFEKGRDNSDRKLQETTRAWRDMWDITLGDAQYQWLQQTLTHSKARYKFVFSHHVLGTGRGGIEQAGLYEWGGKDRRGVDSFAQHRPTWAMPIHQLMVKSGVSVFFQGHDHMFARQELDGVVYQSLPQPADPNYATHYEKAYRSGVALPSSGRVRVTVSPEKVHVEYLRSFLPSDETAEKRSNTSAFSYDLPAVK